MWRPAEGGDLPDCSGSAGGIDVRAGGGGTGACIQSGAGRGGKIAGWTGGKAGQLLRIDSNKNVEVLFAEEEIKYVWSIVVGPDGRIFLGTGPTGKVMMLGPAGAREVLYQAKEKNILVLALHEGILYAGGDENGLVYRIEPASKKLRLRMIPSTGRSAGWCLMSSRICLFRRRMRGGAARNATDTFQRGEGQDGGGGRYEERQARGWFY